MRLLGKILLALVGLAFLLAAPYGVWGERFEILFSQEAASRWFGEIRPYAWAVGAGLLMADLVLPIPATGVMAALGAVYGIWGGTLAAAAGSLASGAAGYALARLGGGPLTRRLAAPEELDEVRGWLDRWGWLAIILSRLLPVLPEAMAVLAGMAGMRPGRFLVALAAGCLPTAFLFATLGHASRQTPAWGLLAALLLPVCLYPVGRRLLAAARR
ncbi:MAG: VTT domain-containing protein [Thermodesulfobacteriota bacterium]